MKAPKYQRMEMLQAATQAAGYELSDPIDGLEVVAQGVVAWAGGRHILLSYRWTKDYDKNGEPLLGSGAWTAEYVRDCDASFRQAPKNNQRGSGSALAGPRSCDGSPMGATGSWRVRGKAKGYLSRTKAIRCSRR